MNRLIKAEINKMFHKKSFYVITLIFIAYACLTNMIYKNINEYEIETESINISELKEKNQTLDLTKENELKEYIENISLIETEEVKKNFKDSSKIYLIDNYLSKIIYEQNENKYIIKDEDLASDLKVLYDECLERVKNNDWEYYTKEKLANVENRLKEEKDETIKWRLEVYKTLANYRLSNKVSFASDNFLNKAILGIEENLVEYSNLAKLETRTKIEENRFNTLQEDYLKNKYILEHKKDINNNQTLKEVLYNFTDEFELFIIIYIVMIAGSIVSEEYNKGTIKYLLTKPYKRRTILTAKLLTVLLLIPLTILFMVVVEIIIGGIILGFSSLTTPVLIYESSSNSLVSYDILKYLILMLVANYPSYLVLSIICFALSTITTSTSAAITITFLFYLAGKVIANLALIYNLKILKAFVSVHWNFDYLVNLVENPYHISFESSIIILFIYISVILCLTYLIFIKKDVKNI